MFFGRARYFYRLAPPLRAPSTLAHSSSLCLTRNPQSSVVPASALVDGRLAVVDAKNRIAWKRVTTGLARENRIEITSGLREGERVVTENADRLKEGQLVRLPENA